MIALAFLMKTPVTDYGGSPHLKSVTLDKVNIKTSK
jgi:hypothetical protein